MEDLKTLEDLNAYHKKKRRISAIVVTIAVMGLFLTFVLTLMVGDIHLSVSEIFSILFGNTDSDRNRYVIIESRLPRLLCCILVGAALSTSGLVMQSLFKNPMASPSVLGISSGAAFGAALAMAFGVGGFMGSLMLPGMAFIFCFITMFLVYMLARTKYGVAKTTLLLSGIAMGAFFSGLISVLQYIVDTDVLARIVYWTMGSFKDAGWHSLQIVLIPIIIGLLIVILNVRELNLISSGEEQAANMGVNVKRVRITMMIATSLMVGGSVAISGVIGFVGLIVPHIFRAIVGPNHAILIPLCIFGGGIFMIAMDTIAKAAFAIPFPVGVLTALIGAPFFIYIMRTRKREMWD